MVIFGDQPDARSHRLRHCFSVLHTKEVKEFMLLIQETKRNRLILTIRLDSRNIHISVQLIGRHRRFPAIICVPLITAKEPFANPLVTLTAKARRIDLPLSAQDDVHTLTALI